MTMRLPHGAVGPVATVRAATFHLKVLQIGQVDDHTEGKGYPSPHQEAFKYVVYPFHNVGLTRSFSKALNYLNTEWRRLELKSSCKTGV
jgi:hypothetical protein